MSEVFLRGKVELYCGDCLDVLKTLPDDSIDSCVTDPPYHLVSVYKRFANEARSEATVGNHAYGRHARGFMGKQWDGGDIAFRPELWAQVLRVLKPGGHLLAFGGTRTYHRMACAIEDAGFEIRDCIQWLYGSGFPKSHDVSKGIDRAAGAEREVVGEGPYAARRPRAGNGVTIHMPAEDPVTAPATDAARQWEGWGTALKPANEPIVLARKPLSESTVAANVLKWGTGAINVDGCRVALDEAALTKIGAKQTTNKSRNFGVGDYAGPREKIEPIETFKSNGRWPANVIHDGSEEVVAGFPESDSSPRTASANHHTGFATNFQRGSETSPYEDSGSAARFFYQVKQDESCSYHASNAENCFLQCLPQSGDIAQSNAPTQEELRIVQNVKSAASLCDSCAIVIAQSLAAMRQGRNPALHQFKDIIGERNAQILNQCLALYVAGRENTDIILTTENLKQLFGSVFYAIGNCTEENDCVHKTAPEKSKRLWYTSKADSDDRLGSRHPTVKPLDLMQYLVRLVTPKSGVVLDPFAGTGTTGEAAWREGMRAILIEREPEYQRDLRRRMELALSGPDERTYQSAKARQGDKAPDYGPLFDRQKWNEMWAKPFDNPELL